MHDREGSAEIPEGQISRVVSYGLLLACLMQHGLLVQAFRVVNLLLLGLWNFALCKWHLQILPQSYSTMQVSKISPLQALQGHGFATIKTSLVRLCVMYPTESRLQPDVKPSTQQVLASV